MNWKVCPSVDRTFLVLLFASFLFTLMVLFVSWKFPQEGQVFQVVSGLATGFAAAALLRIKAPSKDDPQPGQSSSERTVTEKNIPPVAEPEKPPTP